MIKGAIISDCGRYRYQLWRIWNEDKPLCMWIMHNPSKADATEGDPTITRCIRFSASWGYGGIMVGNLSPYRCTNPADMKGLPFDVIAPVENMFHIREMVKQCGMHVLAFGNPIDKDLIPDYQFVDDHWHYLKLTKSGNPYHPLYLKKDLKPIPFKQLTT